MIEVGLSAPDVGTIKKLKKIEAAEGFEKDPQLLETRAKCLEILGEQQAAAETWCQLSGDAVHLMNLSRLKMEMGYLNDAIKTTDHAGAMRDEPGDQAKARSHLQSALAFQADYAIALAEQRNLEQFFTLATGRSTCGGTES